MGGKSKSYTVGYRYYMSILMGLSRGPVDEIVQINVGDVRAWPVPDGDSESTQGEMYIAHGPDEDYGVAVYEDGTVDQVAASKINTWTGSGDTSIKAPKLFGGDKKEGGIDGSLRVMMGTASQIVPNWIKSMIGGRVPDFRGVATLFFDGLVTSLNPYPKSWSFRVRRTLSGWDGEVWQPELATIWMADNSIKAMNGAHIIYECLTNRDWGRGYPREWISESHFLAVAQTLYDEGFGLCLRWNRQGTIGEFIAQVIDHVGGSLYVDRSEGLIALSLLRGDYDPEELPLFTKTTGLISIEDDTMSSDDLVNEVIVNWNDPVMNEDRQARQQNLASLQTLDGKNSTSTSYSGIPEVNLALRVALRDLKISSTVLKRFKVKLDRRAWRITPGALFRVSDPEKDIVNVVLRAGKITDGGLKDGTISVEAVLDVFGLPANTFAAAEERQWIPPNRQAVPVDRVVLREATYGDLVRNLSEADLNTVDEDASTIVAIAGKPTSLSLGYTLVSGADGEDLVETEYSSFTPVCDAVSAITTGQTMIPFENGMDLGLIELGMGVQIGDEICRLEDITVTGVSGTVTVARGCVDTIPHEHPAGTPMFFFEDYAGTDGREYVTGETAHVKLLTTTSTAVLSADLATEHTLEIEARQNLPWAPGNLLVNGTPYWEVGSTVGELVFTWAHRNRLLIQDQLIEHEGSGTTRESGLTYTFRVYDSSDTLLQETTGITGETISYTPPSADTYRFELEAVRGGYVSHSKYDFTIGGEPSLSMIFSNAHSSAPQGDVEVYDATDTLVMDADGAIVEQITYGAHTITQTDMGGATSIASDVTGSATSLIVGEPVLGGTVTAAYGAFMSALSGASTGDSITLTIDGTSFVGQILSITTDYPETSDAFDFQIQFLATGVV